QSPRMLIPFPEAGEGQVVPIKFGHTWEDHRVDTANIVDNENHKESTYLYDIKRSYKFESIADTIGGTAAVVVSNLEGNFNGFTYDENSDDTTYQSGPISGADTTYLNL